MIILVGAGIAGLSVACELQLSGETVVVLDGGKIAGGASGVATSYLEPRLGNTPMRLLEREALKRWEDYTGFLQAKSGIDIGFCKKGQLRVSTDDYLSKLEKDLQAREVQGAAFKRLSAVEIRKREPILSENIVSGAYLPEIRWVTGQNVCAALARIFEDAGGKIKEFALVTSILADDKNISARLSDGSSVSGDKLVLCTGMGANQIKGLPEDIPQSRPVRGVNLVADMSNLSQPLTHMVKHHRGNLCPRADGRLIIGTTYEVEENSLEVAPEIIEMLYANAEPILPNVRDLPLLGVQAGIRAKVGDGMLRLGRSKQAPNLYFSLSHAGAGFLRAPVIAEEFAKFVLDGTQGRFTGQITSG